MAIKIKGEVKSQTIQYAGGPREYRPVLDTPGKTYELSEDFRCYIGCKMTIKIKSPSDE